MTLSPGGAAPASFRPRERAAAAARHRRPARGGLPPRGQEGLDAARDEAATQRALERAEWQKRAVIERLDFQINEYAKLARVDHGGLAEVERRIAAVVARILAAFWRRRCLGTVVDELVGENRAG